MLGFPGGSDGKESACNAGNPGLIPGLGRFPGRGNGNPLQCSCLENGVDRGAWQAVVAKELDMIHSNLSFFFPCFCKSLSEGGFCCDSRSSLKPFV